MGPCGTALDIERANIRAKTIRTTIAAVRSLRNGRAHLTGSKGRRMPAHESHLRPAGECVKHSWQYEVRHRPHRNNDARPA
jgi:hypothetical protein